MKMSSDRYDDLKEGVRQVVDHYGKEVVLKAYAGKSTTRVLWDLFHVVGDNRRYDDTHPMFSQGKRPRVLPHRPEGYDLYADGLDDSHIETALRRIGKELGLT